MKHLHLIKFFGFTFILLFGITSCSSDDMYDKSELTGLSVSLKSSVGQFSDVYLDIDDVQVRVKEDGDLPNAWVSLNVMDVGTQNICDFNTDSELLLVDHFEMQSAYVYEIRLLLGTNNFVNINEVLMYLDVEENTVATNLVKMEFTPNHIYDVVVNIDIDESISFNEDEFMMVLNPKLYTEIRKIEY